MPTKLFKQTSILEMLGFSFNPDEKKYIYVKPGTAGFCKTYSEEHGIEKVVQFLKERRYDSRGDSENHGLVLAAQVNHNLVEGKFIWASKLICRVWKTWRPG